MEIRTLGRTLHITGGCTALILHLLPLNRRRRLRGNVVHDAVHPPDAVADAGRHLLQELGIKLEPATGEGEPAQELEPMRCSRSGSLGKINHFLMGCA